MHTVILSVMMLQELKEDKINLIPELNLYEVWLQRYNFLKLMKIGVNLLVPK